MPNDTARPDLNPVGSMGFGQAPDSHSPHSAANETSDRMTLMGNEEALVNLRHGGIGADRAGVSYAAPAKLKILKTIRAEPSIRITHTASTQPVRPWRAAGNRLQAGPRQYYVHSAASAVRLAANAVRRSALRDHFADHASSAAPPAPTCTANRDYWGTGWCGTFRLGQPPGDMRIGGGDAAAWITLVS